MSAATAFAGAANKTWIFFLRKMALVTREPETLEAY